MSEFIRSGIRLNPNLRDLPYSATLACNELCDKINCKERNVRRLCFGKSPFPVPEVVAAELRANAAQNDYLPVKGLLGLRKAVAAHFTRTRGVKRSFQDVFIGPGSKQLLFIYQLVCQGDLIMAAPSWVSYNLQARILGRKPTTVLTTAEDRWLLHAEALDRVCSENPAESRTLLLNCPSNPAGTAYEPHELEALAAVARKHRLAVLTDEIYGRLMHRGEHVSIARYYPEGTIVSEGISKWCGAGGWRLGTFIFPQELREVLDEMTNVAAEMHTSASAPVQFAAVTAYRGCEEIDNYLLQGNRILSSLGARVTSMFKGTGAVVAAPRGGYYIFPDFSPLREKLAGRGVTTSAQLCERLLETVNVALLPGSDFGMPPESLTARVAFVAFDGAAALTAAAREPLDAPLGDAFLESTCGNLLSGIKLVSGWLRG